MLAEAVGEVHLRHGVLYVYSQHHLGTVGRRVRLEAKHTGRLGWCARAVRAEEEGRGRQCSRQRMHLSHLRRDVQLSGRFRRAVRGPRSLEARGEEAYVVHHKTSRDHHDPLQATGPLGCEGKSDARSRGASA